MTCWSANSTTADCAIYLNVGTRQQPRFGAFRWLEAAGHIASVPTGCAVGFTPQLVDFDNDGDQDILTGSFLGGALFVFRRQADGSFADAEVIVNREGNVKITPRNYNTTVFAYDLDEDGDRDLLVGRSPPYLVLNESDGDNRYFGAVSKIKIDEQPMSSGLVSAVIADWDSDRRYDLIAGKGRDIVWYRNVGASGSPSFESSRVLVAATSFGPSADDGPDELRSRPTGTPYAICVADYDADGRMDLLLGDHYYVQRTLSAEQRDAYANASRLRSAFWRDYGKLIDQSSSESKPDLVNDVRVALRNWDKITNTLFDGPQAAGQNMERHGGVWLYRRSSPTE